MIHMKPTNYLPIILLAFTMCTQRSNTFKIAGHIQNVPDSGIVMLHKVEGNLGRLFMKDTIRNGTFSFEGKTDSIEMLRLVVLGDKYPLKTIGIWIAPGAKTNITGKGHFISTWDVKSNVKEQQEEELYRNAIKELGAESDSLFRLYYDKIDQIEKADNEEEQHRLRTEIRLLRKQLDSLDFMAHRKIFETMAKEPVTQSWIKRLADFAGYSVGYASVTRYPEDNIKLMQELYNRLDEAQKQSPKGQLIYRYIFPMQIIKEGDPMADGILFDPEGNPHEIEQEYKGKYILLDFWSLGCKPCIEAFPEMKEIYREKKDRLFIISITTDTENVWKEGLKKHQLPWVNLTDYLAIEGYASLYGVHGVPYYVLISPDGIVQKMWSGYAKGSLKEKLKEI